MIRTEGLFDLEHTRAAECLAGLSRPWEALRGLSDFIIKLGATLPEDEFDSPAPNLWVHRSAVVAPTAYIGAPCIIDAGTELRHGAFIRGAALIGRDCVVGNSVEVKNAILFDGVQVPHFNYVGDSILGYMAHMGAGSVTSNVRADKAEIVIRGAGDVPTGLHKLGALLGDFTEVGCNAVLNPGTVTGRNATVYPLSCVRGTVPENSIFKNTGEIVKKR